MSPAASHEHLLSSAERRSWPKIFAERFLWSFMLQQHEMPRHVVLQRVNPGSCCPAAEAFLRLHLDVQTRCMYIPAFSSPMPRSWFHSPPGPACPKPSPHHISLVSPSPLLRFLCCSLLTPQQMPCHPLCTNHFHLKFSSWSASRRGQRDFAAQCSTQVHKVAEKGVKQPKIPKK